MSPFQNSRTPFSAPQLRSCLSHTWPGGATSTSAGGWQPRAWRLCSPRPQRVLTGTQMEVSPATRGSPLGARAANAFPCSCMRRAGTLGSACNVQCSPHLIPMHAAGPVCPWFPTMDAACQHCENLFLAAAVAHGLCPPPARRMTLAQVGPVPPLLAPARLHRIRMQHCTALVLWQRGRREGSMAQCHAKLRCCLPSPAREHVCAARCTPLAGAASQPGAAALGAVRGGA